MVTTKIGSLASTRGHVALYARDARWLKAMARGLNEGGHSHRESANPTEMHQLLTSQEFDVLVLKVREESEGREIAEALESVTVPPHAIVTGSAEALPLQLGARRKGSLRYVPGRLPGSELSRLVDVSISAGTAEDVPSNNGNIDDVSEEVDIEDAFERAASEVYQQARRKRQRFRTVVEGPESWVLVNPEKLHHSLAALLRLVVELAPAGAQITTEARSAREDWWAIRLHASAGRTPSRRLRKYADSFREEARMLSAVSRDIRQQGGLLWVELLGPSALSLWLMLPGPKAQEPSASGPSEKPRDPRKKEVTTRAAKT